MRDDVILDLSNPNFVSSLSLSGGLYFAIFCHTINHTNIRIIYPFLLIKTISIIYIEYNQEVVYNKINVRLDRGNFLIE